MSSRKDELRIKFLRQREKLREIMTLLKMNRQKICRAIVANEAQFGYWQRGEVEMPEWAVANLFRDLGVNPEWWHGRSDQVLKPGGGIVAEEREDWYRDEARRELVASVKELVRAADDEVIQALLTNVRIFRRTIKDRRE